MNREDFIAEKINNMRVGERIDFGTGDHIVRTGQDTFSINKEATVYNFYHAWEFLVSRFEEVV